MEKVDGNWIDLLSTIAKQYINKLHSSTKLTPLQVSLKKNEGYIYKNLLDKRKKTKSTFQVTDLVRTTDLKRTFSKEDTVNSFYKLYKSSETKNDPLLSYKTDQLPERFNETLLKKTEVSMKENKDVRKKLNLK